MVCKIQAQATKPFHEDATLTLCQLLSQSGDHDAAVARLEGLLEARPSHTDAKLVLLDTLHRAGKADKLEEIMRTIDRSSSKLDDDAGHHLCRHATDT
jgi:uncharacterized protein HemY